MEDKTRIIIDVNIGELVFRKSPTRDFKTLIDWIENGNGKIIYGFKNGEELFKIGIAKRKIINYRKSGLAERVNNDKFDEIEQSIESSDHSISDDAHIIALARISGTRVLCTHDNDLQTDFKKKELLNTPRGKIYKTHEHKDPVLTQYKGIRISSDVSLVK